LDNKSFWGCKRIIINNCCMEKKGTREILRWLLLWPNEGPCCSKKENL